MKIELEEAEKRLLRCPVCRVAFVDPLPSLDALTEDFVERHITNEKRLEKFGSSRDPVLKAVSSTISRQSPQGAKILDVGCAGGYFLDKFLSADRWEKYGAEASRFASEAAAKKGITMWQGMFASLDLPASFFDVVTVLDAFYYFREPQRDLGIIRKTLKPTGTLWIEVPLAETQIWRSSSAIARTLSRSARALFATNQVFYYNLASLSYLLKETGFRMSGATPVPPVRHPSRNANLLYGSFYGASRVCWALSLRHLNFGPNILVKAVPAA